MAAVEGGAAAVEGGAAAVEGEAAEVEGEAMGGGAALLELLDDAPR